MEYVALGNTGLFVSKIGFGGIPIQKLTRSEAALVLKEAYSNGINFIDSAKGYTVSEEYIGNALTGIRGHFILATKSMARTKESMEQDIQSSLIHLSTSYIDLYQVHNPTLAQLETVVNKNGALEALLEAKESGKIHSIGLTAHSLEVFQKALTLPWVETIMFPYNIVENQGEDLIAACKRQGIGFIAMKPLAGGAIEDSDLALRYILSNPNVSIAIPGMGTKEEVIKNTATCENTACLTYQERNKIEQIRQELGNNFCRRCGYCAPCAVGINIPSVFLFSGYHKRYGLSKWASSRYDTLTPPASACISCGICESRCPYKLPIRSMLKEAVTYFGK